MSAKSAANLLLLTLVLLLLVSCGGTPAKTIIEMEMSDGYGTADPFINERLIYVSEDVGTLRLDISIRMQGESGLLEIEDSVTGDVVWRNTWAGETDESGMAVALHDLEKDRDYVIRFTGREISHASIRVTADDKLVRARERPRKAPKAP